MATNALLDNGDELLLPSPDYPLWTAAASLSGGTPVHYLCDEANGWMPDLDDIRAKVTPRTKGIVVDQPQQPHRRFVFRTSCCEAFWNIAREHGLVVFADEVYDKVLYDGAKHTALGSLSRRRAHAHLQLAVEEPTAPAATALAGWSSPATRNLPRTTSTV